MSSARSSGVLLIGYLRFFVAYYEGICAEFPVEKKAIFEGLARALGEFGEIAWDGQMIRNKAQAGRALA